MTNLSMPKIDRKIIKKKDIIVKNLKKIIKPEHIIDHEDELKPFETDGLSAYKQKPLVVVFPENTKQVSQVLEYCNTERIKVVPRGAGTGLSGGALPLADCVLLCFLEKLQLMVFVYKLKGRLSRMVLVHLYDLKHILG